MGTAATEVRRNTSSVEALSWNTSERIRATCVPEVRAAVLAEARAFFDEEVALGRFNNLSFETFLHQVKDAALDAAREAWNATPSVVDARAPRSR